MPELMEALLRILLVCMHVSNLQNSTKPGKDVCRVCLVNPICYNRNHENTKRIPAMHACSDQPEKDAYPVMENE